LILEDVQDRLDEIIKDIDDDELAHSREDGLYLRVLTFHAKRGCELSKLAISSQKLKFRRWCR